MKKWKQLLSVVLACCLTVGLLPNIAWAADEPEEKLEEDIDTWMFAGSAYYDEDQKCFILTEDYKKTQSGAIWYNAPVDGDFSIELDYYTGSSDRALGGADGITVAFYAEYGYTLPNGMDMGFTGSKGYGVELDTYYGGDNTHDPDYNHIALVKESSKNHLIIERLPESEDEHWHHLKIVVENGICTAYVDNELKLSYEVEETGYKWVGITAATHSGINLHAVKNISIDTGIDGTVGTGHFDISLSHEFISEREKQYIYKITAYVQNLADVPAANVNLTLIAEDLLHLTDGQEATVSVGDIESGKRKVVTWLVSADWPEETETASYSVAASINGGNVTLSKRNYIYWQSKDSRFNAELYRAYWLQKSSDIAVENINQCIAEETPSRILVRELQSNGFENGVALWKSTKILSDFISNPMSITDEAVEAKDLYSAVILNALEASVSYDIIDTEVSDALMDCEEFVSNIKDIMETDYGIILRDEGGLQNLSKEGKEYLAEKTGEWFRKAQPELCELGDVFDCVKAGIDGLETLENYYEHIVSSMTVANLSEEMKTVIRQLYNDCPTDNIYMKSALKDCKKIIDSSLDETLKRISSEEIISAGWGLTQGLFEELIWDPIMDMSPFSVKVLRTAFKTSSYVTDLTFSTNDTIDYYMKMLAVTDFESLVDSTYQTLKSSFASQKTTETAGVYLAALDLIFTLRYDNASAAYNFVDILDESLVNKVWKLFGKDTYSGTKGYIGIRQNRYKDEHINSRKIWIENLEADYTGSWLYKYYSDLYTQSLARTVQKSLSVACPVDVYVYDAENYLVASVIDGRVYCDSVYCDNNISVERFGEKKVIYFYDKTDYQVILNGTDSGEMDVSISEFSDEEPVHTVNFYDIPLEGDKKYSVDFDRDVLVENSTTFPVEPDYDSTKSKSEHTVSVISGVLLRNDELFMRSEAVSGELLELTAYIPEGYHFVRWETSCGNDILDDASAINTKMVMPDKDVTVTAVVEETQVDATSITLNQTSLTLYSNTTPSTATLTATVEPENATDKTVTWNSSNANVATVKNGVVTAVANGTATITATVGTGDSQQSTSCVVTVKSSSGGGGGSSSSSYSVTANTPANGSLTISPKSASKGTTVTITVAPSSGYALETLTATDASGNKLTLTDKGDGTYIFTMPASKVMVSATFAASTTPSTGSFTDVAASDYYYDAVEWAVDQGITTGTSAATFSPNASCTRAQMVTFLWRANGSPATSGENPFTDVKSGAYYYDAVLWAVEKGITKGTSDTTFSPDQTVTRGQTVTFLYRSDGAPAVTGDNSFTDVAADAYYADAVQWAVNESITTGTSAATFSPLDNCTRGQIVTFLYRGAK